MRVHYIQHGVFDEPGVIIDWAEKRNVKLTSTRIFESEALPDVTEFDFLIVLGGSQSLVDDNCPEYIREEIKFVKSAIENDKIVLGICLGAQIIAESLGAKTQRSTYPEIGIFPIQLTSEGLDDPVMSCLSAETNVMHMHYDMFGLVKNAKILAKSDGCERQAFLVGKKVYGIQFHLEMTSRNIQSRLEHWSEEIEAGSYTVTREKLIKSDLTEINKKMYEFLDAIIKKNVARQ